MSERLSEIIRGTDVRWSPFSSTESCKRDCKSKDEIQADKGLYEASSEADGCSWLIYERL
jgi:hypothetical protein